MNEATLTLIMWCFLSSGGSLKMRHQWRVSSFSGMGTCAGAGTNQSVNDRSAGKTIKTAASNKLSHHWKTNPGPSS